MTIPLLYSHYNEHKYNLLMLPSYDSKQPDYDEILHCPHLVPLLPSNAVNKITQGIVKHIYCTIGC